VFIHRLQGHESNEILNDKIHNDGGFIYATSINPEVIGVPRSFASPDAIDEAKQGRPISGLRSYRSMTYAGFKSYVYAGLDTDDPRVEAALDWIREPYTFERHPETPKQISKQGLYYYYLVAARALRAWGQPTLRTEAGAPKN